MSPYFRYDDEITAEMVERAKGGGYPVHPNLPAVDVILTEGEDYRSVSVWSRGHLVAGFLRFLPLRFPPAHASDLGPSLSAAEIAVVLGRLRKLWDGAAEAPGIRSAVNDFCKALHLGAAEAESFWRACGYELLNSHDWKGGEHDLLQGGER